MEPIRLSTPHKPARIDRSFDILVVDDADSVRTLMLETLGRSGFSCRGANDGKEALALLSRYAFRLVIVDIYMPEIDGFGVMAACAARNPDAQILAISGGSTFTSPECSLQPARFLGSHRTLTKPFDLDDFLSVAKAMLTR